MCCGSVARRPYDGDHPLLRGQPGSYLAARIVVDMNNHILVAVGHELDQRVGSDRRVSGGHGPGLKGHRSRSSQETSWNEPLFLGAGQAFFIEDTFLIDAFGTEARPYPTRRPRSNCNARQRQR